MCDFANYMKVIILSLISEFPRDQHQIAGENPFDWLHLSSKYFNDVLFTPRLLYKYDCESS